MNSGRFRMIHGTSIGSTGIIIQFSPIPSQDISGIWFIFRRIIQFFKLAGPITRAPTEISGNFRSSNDPYVVGDVNNNSVFNGLDVVYSVNYFKGIGPAPPYMDLLWGRFDRFMPPVM